MPIALRRPASAQLKAPWLLSCLLLLGACQDRIYAPPVKGMGDAAAPGTEDGATPGGSMDAFFMVGDTRVPVTPDVGMGTGIDAPPIPTGPVCGDGKVE